MKYLGSKNRIVDEIIPIMLKNYNGNCFVDLFCGGCSVVENIPSHYKRIANDKQKYLIAMWKSLVNNKTFPVVIEKEFYSRVRDCYNGKNNDYDDDLIGWIGFMASFNGRFFDGGYSGHHVKNNSGKERDYIRENIKNTIKQIQKLKNVEFYSGEYYDCPFPENSLIYCDPPYQNTKQYATSKNFDYNMFYDWLRTMKEDGHTIYVSEYQMPEDFICVWQKEITNSINPIITKKPVEKLFTLP